MTASENGGGLAERVLVVDDDPSVRRLIARVVGAGGQPVETAANAAEARRLLASRDFAVVVADLAMPGEPGISLVRWIRGEHPDVAVLIATGTNDADVADAALELGAYGYLTKPFKHNELTINVAGALRRRRLEIENRELRDELERRFLGLVTRLPAIVYLWEAGAEGQCYYV